MASSSAMRAPHSTMKASLLQIPARRPVMTPIRFLATSASSKSDSYQQNRVSESVPAGPTFFDKPDQRVIATPLDSPKFSFFEDEIDVRDEEANESLVAKPSVQEGCVEAGASQESQPSEEYSDENALPLDPQLFNSEPTFKRPTLTCTPQKLFSSRPREIHTVSKVPLRPSSDDSPIDLPRKRSRSLAGPLTDINASQQDEDARNDIFLPTVHETSVLKEVTSGPSTTVESFVSEVSYIPGGTIFSNFMSPVGN